MYRSRWDGYRSSSLAGFLLPDIAEGDVYRSRNAAHLEATRGNGGVFPEINCIWRRYVYGGITYHETLTSLTKRMVESHKDGALQSNVLSFIRRWEGGRKRGWSRAAESVSKLKFVSGNPWQRVRANRFHLHRVLPSPILARPFISAVSDF